MKSTTTTVQKALFQKQETISLVQKFQKLKKPIVWSILSVLFVTQVTPLLWLLIYSLKTNEEILEGGIFSLPAVPQWNNYIIAFTSGNYLQYLFNSLFVTGVSLLLALILSAMVAYAITRFKFKYGQLIMVFFIIGIMIPIQSTLLPLVIIFKNLKILDTYTSLILPYVAFAIPLAVFILSGFFKSIPTEIEESAVIDGASVYRIFWSIILPISIPPIMTVTILTFISIWNEYIMAATFISSNAIKTLPFGINSFFGQYTTNYGALGAFLVLGALPVVLFYFALSEKITKGMVEGAVKG